jgi:hypothetical protein
LLWWGRHTSGQAPKPWRLAPWAWA